MNQHRGLTWSATYCVGSRPVPSEVAELHIVRAIAADNVAQVGNAAEQVIESAAARADQCTRCRWQRCPPLIG
jgi:hypothetical protein